MRYFWHFWAKKSQKWPKNHFLFWKVEIFFGTPQSFGKTNIFHVIHFLIRSKKVGKNGKKLKKWPMQKSAHFPFLPTFFDQIKNVKTEKFWSPQMIKVCQKKIPLFKIKNGFLAIFVILAKTRKWQKIHFFWKSGIFFATQNSVRKTKIF